MKKSLLPMMLCFSLILYLIIFLVDSFSIRLNANECNQIAQEVMKRQALIALYESNYARESKVIIIDGSDNMEDRGNYIVYTFEYIAYKDSNHGKRFISKTIYHKEDKTFIQDFTEIGSKQQLRLRMKTNLKIGIKPKEEK